jgi:hypothetical protein
MKNDLTALYNEKEDKMEAYTTLKSPICVSVVREGQHQSLGALLVTKITIQKEVRREAGTCPKHINLEKYKIVILVSY